MNITLEINNLKSCNFSKKKLKLIVEKTIEKTTLKDLSKKNLLISVGLLSEEEIKKINKKYRNKNSPTDILSFGDFNSIEEILSCKEKSIFLGEILICIPDIKKYCFKKDIPFEKEFFKVFSHGILHLLGFVHGKEMFAIQNDVATEVS